MQAKVRGTKAVTSRWFETLWVCTEVVLEKIIRTLVKSAETWSTDLFFCKSSCLCIISTFFAVTCYL